MIRSPSSMRMDICLIIHSGIREIPDVLSQKLTQLSRQGTSLTQVAFTSLLLDLSKDDGRRARR